MLSDVGTLGRRGPWSLGKDTEKGGVDWVDILRYLLVFSFIPGGHNT